MPHLVPPAGRQRVSPVGRTSHPPTLLRLLREHAGATAWDCGSGQRAFAARVKRASSARTAPAGPSWPRSSTRESTPSSPPASQVAATMSSSSTTTPWARGHERDAAAMRRSFGSSLPPGPSRSIGGTVSRRVMGPNLCAVATRREDSCRSPDRFRLRGPGCGRPGAMRDPTTIPLSANTSYVQRTCVSRNEGTDVPSNGP